LLSIFVSQVIFGGEQRQFSSNSFFFGKFAICRHDIFGRTPFSLNISYPTDPWYLATCLYLLCDDFKPQFDALSTILYSIIKFSQYLIFSTTEQTSIEPLNQNDGFFSNCACEGVGNIFVFLLSKNVGA
jgi:hypothetical protein